MARLRHRMLGVGQLKAKLQRMGQAASADSLEAAVTGGALLVKNEAQRLAPKLTTTLARGITIVLKFKSATRAVVSISTSNIPYAKIQEFGGTILPKRGKFLVFPAPDGKTLIYARKVTLRAQPYMRPAWDTKQAEAVKEIARLLRILIMKAAKG